MMPHVHTSVFLLLALLALAVAQPESSASYDEDAESAPYEDEGADGFLESNPHLQEMFGRLQRSVDADGLLRARRWGNIANGALLAATGPIALVVSVFGLKLSNIVLSLYVTAFGGLLAGIELGANPIAPWVRSNLQYLHTAPGRTALLAFLGGLTWPLGRMGLVPALLTCFNAVFNANFAQLLAFVSADDGSAAARGHSGPSRLSGRQSAAAAATAAGWADDEAAVAAEVEAMRAAEEAAAAHAGAEAALAAANAAAEELARGGGAAAPAEEALGEEEVAAMLEAARAARAAS